MMTIHNHTLGFPRIGLRRELKKAQESHWAGNISRVELLAAGRVLRIRHWEQQNKPGSTWYSHVMTTYFEGVTPNLDTITALPIQGQHVDLVQGKDEINHIHQQLPDDWLLSAGVINGRNVWRTDLSEKYQQLKTITDKRQRWVASSCSLLFEYPNEIRQALSNMVKRRKTCVMHSNIPSRQQTLLPAGNLTVFEIILCY